MRAYSLYVYVKRTGLIGCRRGASVRLRVLRSGEQLRTAEILERESVPLQVRPLGSGRDATCRLPNGPQHPEQNRPAIVVVERLPVIAGHASLDERARVEGSAMNVR